MKQMVLPLALAAFLAPQVLPAQEDDQGRTLMERGIELFMDGLIQQMDPALEELEGLSEEIGPTLRQFAETMGPALRDLMEQVEDWSAYHPPEILPNGDIILRRKTPEETSTEEGDGAIEL